MPIFGINTPEFGVSERISDLLGRGRNVQGGSNLFGGSQQAPAYGGDVLGATTTTPSFNPTPTSQGNYSVQNNPNTRTTTPSYSQPNPQPNPQPQQSNPAQDQARQEVNGRESALRGQIDSGFNSLKQGYNDMIPYYQQEGDRRVGQVGETYKTIFSGLGQAKQAGMDKLALSRQEVERRSANSVADLKQNLNQVMRNTGMQLGAMGAGDTSASQVMAPYAYTKMAGNQFGGIARQSNDQFGEIDQKNVDLEQEYGQMYNQTELEKSSQIENVRSEVGQQIARIREMIPQVDSQRAQALAGLEQSLLSQAQQALVQIQSEDRQRKDGLQQWALQRVAQLNDAKMSLQGTANFDPRAVTFNELQSVGAQPAYGQDQEQYYNPQMLAQKRREELGL